HIGAAARGGRIVAWRIGLRVEDAAKREGDGDHEEQGKGSHGVPPPRALQRPRHLRAALFSGNRSRARGTCGTGWHDAWHSDRSNQVAHPAAMERYGERVSTAIDSEGLPARLEDVRRRIAEATLRAGRAADSVRLVAVSKGKPAEAIRAAYA